MRIYLDDDLDSNMLIRLLRQAGHEVLSPRDAGTRGVTDIEHLQYAASHQLVILTANAGDFIDLHYRLDSTQANTPGDSDRVQRKQSCPRYELSTNLSRGDTY